MVLTFITEARERNNGERKRKMSDGFVRALMVAMEMARQNESGH